MAQTVSSPDGKTVVTLDVIDGMPVYNVTYDGNSMLENSPLGFKANVSDFTKGMTKLGSESYNVEKSYTQDRVKKSNITYTANGLRNLYRNANGDSLTIAFQVSDNNVAYRYEVPKAKNGQTGSIVITEEASGFTFPDGTTTFLCPQSDAMIGWKRTKPSYEEEYKVDASMTDRSGFGHGYTFPCLFRIGDNGWVLLTETGVDSHYCASHLSDSENGNTYRITFPMAEENNGNGTPWAAFALPGVTTWRTITVGDDLAPIVETTITYDLVDPLYEPSREYKPGRGTWSWILWQDNSINMEDQKAYVDLAQAMGYEYVLVDNWWDLNIGRDRIPELVKYANDRGVDVVLWYSSSGYWNDIVQGPINYMDNSIVRKKEMKWLKDVGVKGIKVDFFGGDKQETMRLYEEIISDANDYGLQVIFHGCTLPRGWERMYPNHVGSEAVLASENLVFDQHHCDIEAFSATLHPYIRNSVALMEYGGSFLNRHTSRDNKRGPLRKTTDTFSLATAVLFQNPIQNFALAPNNLEDANPICLDFLREVPTTWDDVRYIDGYPGKYAVIGRRNGNTWYIAGVNAETDAQKLNLDLSPFMAKGQSATLYSDAKTKTGEYADPTSGLSTTKQTVTPKKPEAYPVTIPTNGGFVLVIE
ncbi:MAG: glycoside hydrolase family 97 protein [Bacteroidales bacterium]|nr:glycoside hydrolase family 97 protein [Bacteroidales bacterium]